ncbi:MAG TPA: two-component regulator propeller domain-containing protein [Chitinophagaceae bacterium]|nr:two-component regulator propeller domain-containing protein [Chitinophagaceae bacterium]
MQRWLLTYCLLMASGMIWAQGPPPVGQWREHLPWNNAIALAVDKEQVICATPYAAFIYDVSDNSFTRWSKVNGLNDIGVTAFGFDPSTGIAVIAYNNSNLDVLKGDRVVNIPDIRISTAGGDKSIRRVIIRAGVAYLSTGLGIILVDLEKSVIKDTWRIGASGDEIAVNGVAFAGDSVYAATSEGLKRSSLSSNPADHRNWQLVPLPSGPASHVLAAGNRIYAQMGEVIYFSAGTSYNEYYRGNGIRGIDTAGQGLLVSESLSGTGKIVQTDASGGTIKVFSSALISFPRQAVLQGSDCWIADQDNGLLKLSASATERVFPNSPINIATGQMLFIGNELWAAAGTVTDAWNYTFNPNGIYRFSNQYWDGFNKYVYPRLDSVLDIITLTGQPLTGSVFGGSYGGGLLEIRKDNSLVIHKQNSPLRAAIGDPGSYRVSGLATDKESNVWVANYGAPSNLHVLKADGNWRSFSIPFLHDENALSAITIDEQGQKWIVSPKENGLFVFNSGSSIDNTGDDRWKYYRQGRGNGNLPSNNVFCTVMDRNGFIWVGTDRGIAVITCIENAVNSDCEAVLPIVQQDNFAGFLFGDEEVLAMAVDGANRKWVGTRNGLWLISAEGDKIIYQFTKSNSPLLANEVSSLAIDPLNGELFIGTSSGICSFRSTATEPSTGSNNVLVYPNPVPPGYAGTIAVRGLPANSTVKITELDGRLVYQARSLGGQFTWNGRDYKGNKASSGVYLVLVADEQNREKLASKIFFTR